MARSNVVHCARVAPELRCAKDEIGALINCHSSICAATEVRPGDACAGTTWATEREAEGGHIHSW